jgi:very-short-patch-repair endonuclease
VRTGRRGHSGITVHTTRSLHPDDATLGDDGLRQTTWARAVIDLAELFDVHATSRILERSVIERHYNGLTLAPAMTRAHGRHGLPTLIAALNKGHHLDPQRTRSGQEEAYLQVLRQSDDDYRLNHWMWVHDRFIGADVWFPQQRLIVELDSRWHDTAGARARDAARDEACRRAGIEVRRLRPYSSAPSSRSTRRKIASEDAYVESIP